MDIILIPGLWLDGPSWDEVAGVLEKAGHRAHPLTLPGMQSRDADRSEIRPSTRVRATKCKVALSNRKRGFLPTFG